SAQPLHHPILESEHLAAVRLVVEAAEVQDSVDHGLDLVLRPRGAHDDVPQLPRARRGPGPVHREGEHVGRLVAPAVLAVQAPHLVLWDERDRQVALRHAGRPERRPRRSLDLRHSAPVDLDLDRYGFSREAYSPYAATIRCTSLCRTTSSPPKRTNSMPSTEPRMSPI